MPGPGRLFIGRLNRRVRVEELERIFESYGKLCRCDVKFGMEMAYAFVDYEDKRDAEDALNGENGRDFMGERMVVEWAKSNRQDYRNGDYRDRREPYRDDRRRERRRSFSRGSRSPYRSRSRGRR